MRLIRADLVDSRARPYSAPLLNPHERILKRAHTRQPVSTYHPSILPASMPGRGDLAADRLSLWQGRLSIGTETVYECQCIVLLHMLPP